MRVLLTQENPPLQLRAVELAFSKVNLDPDILPGYRMVPHQMYTHSSLDAFGNIQNLCEIFTKKVGAIIGPMSSTPVKAVYPICEGVHIPMIAPMATDPTFSTTTSSYKYLLKMLPPDNVQSRALADIMNHFGWEKLAILTSSSDYGINSVREFVKIAIQRNWKIVAHEQFYAPQDTYTETVDADSQLRSIRSKGARIILLSCLAEHARIVLAEAKNKGMTQRGWVWLVTDGITTDNLLFDETCDKPGAHLIGLIGTRPTISEGELYEKFSEDWSTVLEVDNTLPNCTLDYPVDGMLLYDAVIALAYGLNDFVNAGNKIELRQFPNRLCSMEDVEPWESGELLMEYISNTSGPGVMNMIAFDKYRTPDIGGYDIVNMHSTGFKKIGEWYSDDNYTFFDDQEISFMGRSADLPKDSSNDLTNITLSITTILEKPFVMELEGPNINPNSSDRFYGYCIDLLNELKKNMKFEYVIEVVPDGSYGNIDPFTNEWNGMVKQLLEGNADVAVAPFTISYEREQVIDFTKPYLDLGLTILMSKSKKESGLFAFLDPFSMDLWLAVILTVVLVGFLVAGCSYFSPNGYCGEYIQSPEKRKDEFVDRNSMNLYNAMWWSFAAGVQQGAENNPKSLAGRVVATFWWLGVTIIIATYTANLAAFLTVSKASEGINSIDDLSRQTAVKYGTVEDSQPQAYFENAKVDPFQRASRYMNSQQSHVTSAAEGIKAVRDGNYAFIFDSAVLDYEANVEPCDVRTVGRLFGKIGYGLGLARNSLYTEPFSLEILKLRQSDFMDGLQKRYFSGGCDGGAASNATPSKIGISQMLGVFYFLFVGIGIAIVLLVIDWIVASLKEARNSRRSTSVNSISACGALRRRVHITKNDVFKSCKTRDDYDDDADYAKDIPMKTSSGKRDYGNPKNTTPVYAGNDYDGERNHYGFNHHDADTTA
ncbi:glutamate receptor 2-like [Antedon mediterranea]|uniref:glutamate receptor 2-like n=1 Tax=Antedon mediterranea TaxID=105859 RepID=UPI003AF99077